jgi:hypothetical protein
VVVGAHDVAAGSAAIPIFGGEGGIRRTVQIVVVGVDVVGRDVVIRERVLLSFVLAATAGSNKL